MKEVLEKIVAAAHECGEIILNADRSEIGIKDKEGRANFVTAYDCRVQENLQRMLKEILPEAEFLGEEEGSTVNPDADKKSDKGRDKR